MKYDIQALQIFQEVLYMIKKDDSYYQVGICRELHYTDVSRSTELQTWMHGKYMPDKRLGIYWWPIQARKDRIAFLERIIEDIMSGE